LISTDSFILYLVPFFGALIGIGFALGIRNFFQSNLNLFLSFSAAFILGIIFLKMLRELFLHNYRDNVELFILLGMLFQICIERFSQGIEHGHGPKDTSHKYYPIILIAGLSLHAFVEGFPLTHSTSLLWGVAIHKISIGFVLTMALGISSISKILKMGFLFIFSLATPLGMLVSGLQSFDEYIPYLIAFSLGILLHISSQIIFEGGKGHKLSNRNLFMIILGILSAYLL